MSGKIQVRLAVLATLAALVAVLVPAGLASGNADLDAIGFLDCGDETLPADDAAAATALASAGYTCTRLFNKPTIDSDPQQVGQMWFKLDGTVLAMRVLFFGGGNTGFGDSKVCLDDDVDPINDVAPGGANAPTCIGSEFRWSVNQGGDGGPVYSGRVKSASQREEPEGKLEVAVDGLTEVSESFGGTVVGGWNVNLGPNSGDIFTEILPHFNLGGFSIVGYFQPIGQRILCGETITLSEGDLTASFTLVGIEGLANDDPDCFKEITTAIDGEERSVLIEPTGGGGVATFTSTITAENELLDLDPNTEGYDSVGLFIDTTSPFDFVDGEPLEPCLLDENDEYAPPADGWGYTRSLEVPQYSNESGHIFGIEIHDLCAEDADPSLRF